MSARACPASGRKGDCRIGPPHRYVYVGHEVLFEEYYVPTAVCTVDTHRIIGRQSLLGKPEESSRHALEFISQPKENATMKSASYWKTHYIVETDVDEIERNVGVSIFASAARSFELLHFEKGKNAPNILISPGSAGHSYVFAELGYQMHLRGYNVL